VTWCRYVTFTLQYWYPFKVYWNHFATWLQHIYTNMCNFIENYKKNKINVNNTSRNEWERHYFVSLYLYTWCIFIIFNQNIISLKCWEIIYAWWIHFQTRLISYYIWICVLVTNDSITLLPTIYYYAYYADSVTVPLTRVKHFLNKTPFFIIKNNEYLLYCQSNIIISNFI